MHFRLRKVLSCTPKVLFNSEKYFPGALQMYFPTQKSTFLGIFRLKKVLLWAQTVLFDSLNYFSKQFWLRKVISCTTKVLFNSEKYFPDALQKYFPTTQKCTFLGFFRLKKVLLWAPQVFCCSVKYFPEQFDLKKCFPAHQNYFPTLRHTFLRRSKSTFRLLRNALS